MRTCYALLFPVCAYLSAGKMLSGKEENIVYVEYNMKLYLKV